MVDFDDPTNLTDAELSGAYLASDGAADDPILAKLLAEMQRREMRE